MLEIENINVYYGQIHALKNVSLQVKEGQIVSVIGANGAGKSTLMMTIAGILKSKTGSIKMEDKILPNEAYKVPSRKICLVPERRRLYANLTVKENLLMGAYLRGDRRGIQLDLERMLDTFPIMRDRIKQYAGTLSGGEQQMVAIARGLMSRLKLLMLDEPSLGLAPMMIEQVFETLKEVRGQGTTIFMSEQNAYMSMEISDYTYVLETGAILLSGPGKELMEDPLIQKAYLGIKTLIGGY